ncbi:RCC1 domain-containing protein [Paenibacillus dendritiformis]|uniref:RCC1 domain-containing protein n=1 Tax=Paenibacillus dendritiformis TaxID=130049 RepID=UPI00366807A3
MTKDGKLYGWGSNREHQIDTGAASQYMTPRLIGTYTGVKKMQAGEDFSLLLLNNGQLYGWGNLQWLGLENAGTPTLIERFGREKIADVSAYEHNAVILTANGGVYQMGGTLYGFSVMEPEHFIWKVDIGQAKAIAAGSIRGYAVLKDGTVWSWKNIVQKKKYAAEKLPGFPKMATIAAGSRNGDFAVGLDEKGNPWAWGNNSGRNLGFELPFKMQKGTDASAAPTRNFDAISNGPIGKRDKPTYSSVTAGSHGAILLTKNKEMLFFGYLSIPFRTGNLYQKADYVAAAGSNVFVISNGQLWAYGTDNDDGQLGNGTRANYDTAQTIRFSK